MGYPIPPESVYRCFKDIPDFAQWVSSYYQHGDLSSRDFAILEQTKGVTSKKPTTDTIPAEELQAITDFGPIAYETVLIESEHFISLFKKQMMKALFDPQIREDWGGHQVWCVYGEASTWLVHYTFWQLEKIDKSSEIKVKVIPGANHFVRRF